MSQWNSSVNDEVYFYKIFECKYTHDEQLYPENFTLLNHCYWIAMGYLTEFVVNMFDYIQHMLIQKNFERYFFVLYF